MANPPPPYSDITGISRAAMKDNAQITLANYSGNARPGELVVNLETDPPLLYVGNNVGQLTLVASAVATTWATLGDKNNASGPEDIALGFNTGANQGALAVAIGFAAGNAQGNNSIAIGTQAGNFSQGIAAIAIGQNAGITSQGTVSVAIGQSAGQTSQGSNSVAIGTSAGQTSQSISATAVGSLAGSTGQGIAAVAIGSGAGETSQGTYSVAVGSLAGRTSQANNSIIINATNANLNQTTANTFTVKPVRAVTSVTFAAPTSGSIPAGFSPMYYNPTTGEIIVITT